MQVIFILSPEDGVVLIKTIYQIATWLKEERGMEIILYLPQIKNFNLLPRSIIELRWLKDDLPATEIPEADTIFSTSAKVILKLSELSRGELVFIAQSKDTDRGFPGKVRVIDFAILKPIIPERLFAFPEECKRDRIIIAGDKLSLENIEGILTSIEKAGTSIFTGEIVILDFRDDIEPETSLNFTVKRTEEIDLFNLLANSFYFFWIGEKDFPLLSLWAMAAGAIVINIESGGISRSFPLEFYQINPLELALCLIKVHKLGQYRQQIKGEFKKILDNYSPEIVGEEWAKFLEKKLNTPDQEDIYLKPSFTCSKEGAVLDLIVVNYNSCHHLRSCLTSIQKFTPKPYQIIIIDNNSTDGSKEYLRQLEGIKIIENDKNLGYASACNQGILYGKSQYLALLNSDIEVKAGWLEPLLKVLAEEDVAVVGPKMINKQGYIVGAGVDQINDSFWPRGWMEKDKPGVFDQQEDVISVGGACYLIKRELIPVLGLFDENYFFYFEELDYSLRAREKGYRVVYCPQSIICHHHEGSLDLDNFQERLKRSRYFIDSKKRFQGKWNCVIAGGKKRREHFTIVVAGLIPWDFRQQRPQHLLRNMVKLGYRIFYLNPVCGDFAPQEVEKGIYVYSPSGNGTIVYNILHGNETRLGREISDKIRELGFEDSILIVHAPYWVPLLKFWEYSLLVFDCIDQYTEFADLAPYHDVLDRLEEKLLDLSDLVLTPSTQLYIKKKSINKNTYLLPNGVDIEHFHYQYTPPIRPVDLPVYPKIIGYFGAISSWFNVDLVRKMATKLTDAGIVLIGEVSTDISKLSRIENISLLGEKPYLNLPDYLAYFDLTIIPFRKNELTNLADPVKIYEYLAGGIPVLSVDLPELSKFKDIVELAENEDEFSKKAELMLAEGRNGAEKRFNSVKDETWENRAIRLKELLHLAYYDLFLEDNGDIQEQEENAEASGEVDLCEGAERGEEDVIVQVKRERQGWLKRIKKWLKVGGDN